MFGGNAEPDAQRQILRGIGGADNLFELFARVERKGADAMIEIGLTDGLFGLDRMHEMERCRRKKFADKANLGNRRDIIIGDPAVPQQSDQIGRRVGLDGIKRAARKLFDKKARGARRCVRTNKRNRLNRALCDHDSASGFKRGGC